MATPCSSRHCSKRRARRSILSRARTLARGGGHARRRRVRPARPRPARRAAASTACTGCCSEAGSAGDPGAHRPRRRAREGIDAVAAGAAGLPGQGPGRRRAAAARSSATRSSASRAEDAQRQLREAQLLADENARLERGLLPPPLLAERRRAARGPLPARRPAGAARRRLLRRRRPAGRHACTRSSATSAGTAPTRPRSGVVPADRVARAGAGRRPPETRCCATLDQVLVAERHGEGIFTTVCMVDRRTGPAVGALLRSPGTRAAAAVGRQIVDRAAVQDRRRRSACCRTRVDRRRRAAAGRLGARCYTDGLIEGRVRPATRPARRASGCARSSRSRTCRRRPATGWTGHRRGDGAQRRRARRRRGRPAAEVTDR